MSLLQSKSEFLLPKSSTQRSRRPSWASRILAIVSVAVVFGTLHLYYSRPLRSPRHLGPDSKELCPQQEALTPVKHADLYNRLGSIIENNEYKLRAIDWLAGAVKIPTESYDEMGPVGEDPRWDAFAPFHDYLLEAFPLVHKKLQLTKVNTYGLVYHWQGSDEALKPLALTAHQDVVPVHPNTVDQWVHPPYSGYFDGEYIWGRGSSDDKSGLISTMSAVQTLLEQGFEPTRTVILAFGFDEETSGLHGAQQIAKYLLEKYGENSFALLVDEGGGWSEVYGQVVAVPAIAEKGYIDVRVQVSTPGGHSSVPPHHTSIGILSSLLVAVEANPHVVHIGRTQPSYKTLQCLAEHTPDMPAKLRKNIKRSATCDKAMRRVEKDVFARDPVTKAAVGTTQAIDLINGGVKTNALPEQAVAIVNHRIATDSSLDAVKQHVTKLMTPLASKFNLSLTSFGNDIFADGKPRYGSLELAEAWGTALSPAPISPTDSPAFKLLSGSIKQALLDSELFRGTGSDVVIAPGIMTGNTDTRYYWKLTPDIVRYNHHGAIDSYKGGELGGVHTVNEAMSISGIQRQIKFFSTLILNSDEATTL